MKNLKELIILHSNDMHGDFQAEQIDEKLVGGVSLLSGYVNMVRNQEKNVLYAFSMPSFYYKGMRVAVNARYELNKHIILQAKYGTTHYFNRDKISSALEEIDGSTKSDLYLQLRLKF